MNLVNKFVQKTHLILSVVQGALHSGGGQSVDHCEL